MLCRRRSQASGGIKLFLDRDWGTEFHWDQAELDEYVLSAHRIGWQVTAHAISAEAHDPAASTRTS
ncbi:hypothetical protein GCM10009789_29230 [Kribbella sancticallisti]|uniref:Hydrolase n=1 Tax=Kribbella sancticallisti TaxID=460087 RepID=A0ABP4P7Q9_9ACTN